MSETDKLFSKLVCLNSFNHIQYLVNYSICNYNRYHTQHITELLLILYLLGPTGALEELTHQADSLPSTNVWLSVSVALVYALCGAMLASGEKGNRDQKNKKNDIFTFHLHLIRSFQYTDICKTVNLFVPDNTKYIVACCDLLTQVCCIQGFCPRLICDPSYTFQQNKR